MKIEGEKNEKQDKMLNSVVGVDRKTKWKENVVSKQDKIPKDILKENVWRIIPKNMKTIDS